MKVFAISDLHFSNSTDKPMDVFGGEWIGYEEKLISNWKQMISEEDIVLIAGDISWGMTLQEAQADIDTISALPGKKVIIKGNHDYWWQSISSVRNALPNNFYALQNDSVKIGNFIICGTRGWLLPEEGKNLSKEDEKILNREIIRLELSLQNMQKNREEKNIVICMMHYPPFNNSRNQSAFTNLISRYKIDKTVYGHVHGKRDKRGNITNIDGIEYILTSCDQINNTPILLFEA